MEMRKIKRLFAQVLMIVILTACSSSSKTPTSQPEATTTEEPPATLTEPPAATEASTMPIAGEGACANAYYPVREGATWTYASTGGPTGGYSFTDTITAVRDDGFTLTSQFSNLTRTQEWACKPEGLVALQLGGGALTSQNLNLQVETQNVSGVSYPTDIKTGDQWDYALDFTGKMDISGNSGEAQGSDKNHFNALGTESVTVPAGTFDAMKIQVDTTLDISVKFQGLSVPVTFSGSYTYWFAQGVGWVKASGTGNMAGTSFSETIELQSYNIP